MNYKFWSVVWTSAVFCSVAISVNAQAKYDIVDSHLHYTDFLGNTDGFPALCEAMDKAGVSKAVVFGLPMMKMWDETMPQQPTYYLSNDSRCYYNTSVDYILADDLQSQPEAVRERFLPFICGVNMSDQNSAEKIEALLKRYPGFWKGIGELMSRHDDLTALTYGEAPHINSAAFKKVFDLAARVGLPVLVHHNISCQTTVNDERENIQNALYLHELEDALAYNRDCRIIWAHIGISRRIEVRHLVDNARRLLADNSNLWIDISWLVYDYYFKDGFPTGYKDGDTMEDWIALVNEFPDRIMIGTDIVGHWKNYCPEITKYYDLLSRLDKDTADKLCRKNILSLVGK